MKKIQRAQEIQRYLTWILLQDTRLHKYFFLDTKTFWKYKPIWDYVIKSGIGDQPDLVELASDCWMENPSDVIELAYTTFTGNPVRYLKELVDICYYTDTNKLSNEGYEELIEIKNRIDKATQWDEDIKYSMQGIGSEILDKVYDNTYNEKISCGLPELDEVMDFWIVKGRVMRINAYSNTGKSKLAYFFCANLLKQGKDVLFFNLEVQRDIVLKNIGACYTGTHIKDVKTENIGDYLDQFSSLPLTIVDDKWTWDDIAAYAEKRKPDVMFIDFIQNIEIEWGSMYEQSAKLAKKIQKFAINHNVAIIDVSQISNEWARNYTFGWVIPSKGGWEFVASADIALVLTPDNTDRRILNLYVAKNKYGEKCAFDMVVDFRLNRFKILNKK